MSYISLVLRWLERAKGQRTVTAQHLNQPHTECYVAQISDASTITLFCREVRYRIEYTAWWAWGRNVSVYQVYCTTSASATEQVRHHFGKELKIGELLHQHSFAVDQKKAAINAYLDLLLTGLL